MDLSALGRRLDGTIRDATVADSNVRGRVIDRVEVLRFAEPPEYMASEAWIDQLEGQLEELAAKERYAEKVEWLTSAPGVGLITAMTFLVEIGDISRFDSCEEFAAFLGLVPSESSSGERIRRGELVRGGKRRVRTALVEASWNAIGQDEGLQEVYDRLKLRLGEGASRIAIVGIARRMALAFRAMLRDEEGWRSPAERRAKRQSEPPDG
jgi:transposase